MESVPLDADQLSKQDAVLLITNHTDIDYEGVLEHSSLIVDTRGVYRVADERVIKA